MGSCDFFWLGVAILPMSASRKAGMAGARQHTQLLAEMAFHGLFLCAGFEPRFP
jgi:hypothetical protein